MEIWKDIQGYEGLYQISNFGNVKSFKRYKNGSLLSPKIDKDGYKNIGIRDNEFNRKFFRVHRLVAEAFIPNPNNLPQINHIDCNPSNNNVDNLEWCTIEYNNKYRFDYGKANNKGENGSCATLSNQEANEIRELWNTEQYMRIDLANMFKVSEKVIGGIINNTTYYDENYTKLYEGVNNIKGIKNKSAKLNMQQAREIRYLYTNKKTSYEKLAKQYGVARKTIERIIKNITWKDSP